MLRAHISFATCFALVLAAPAALADVLVVAPSGAPFRQISAAVEAAQDGDIVLVKSGVYNPFEIQSKSLSVLADEGASVTVSTRIDVRFIPPHQPVVLRGLASTWLYIEGCAGPVRIEQCSFLPSVGKPSGAYVGSSGAVAFAHCSFVGTTGHIADGVGWPTAVDGGHGLSSSTSTVSLWQCSMTGGEGGKGGTVQQATMGGLGVATWGGAMVLDGCTLTGGVGGVGATNLFGGTGGKGGNAMHMNLGGLLRHTDTSFVGGAGGAGGPNSFGGTGAPGAPGGGLIPTVATVAPLLGEARDLTVNSPVRGGQTATFQFGTVSCDAVFLLYSLATQDQWLGGPQGTLITSLPLGLVSLPLPCATGTQPFSTLVPALPAGLDGVNVFLQALHDNSTEGLQLGPFTVLTLVDAAIP